MMAGININMISTSEIQNFCAGRPVGMQIRRYRPIHVPVFHGVIVFLWKMQKCFAEKCQNIQYER